MDRKTIVIIALLFLVQAPLLGMKRKRSEPKQIPHALSMQKTLQKSFGRIYATEETLTIVDDTQAIIAHMILDPAFFSRPQKAYVVCKATPCKKLTFFINGYAINPQYSRAIVYGEDTVQLIDLIKQKTIKSIQLTQNTLRKKSRMTVAFGTEGALAAYIHPDCPNILRIVTMETLQCYGDIKVSHNLVSAQFNDNATLLALLTHANDVPEDPYYTYIRNIKIIHIAGPCLFRCLLMKFSPNNVFLAVAMNDAEKNKCYLVIYELKDPIQIKTILPLTDPTDGHCSATIKWSHTNNSLIIMHNQRAVIWDIEQKVIIRTIPMPKNTIKAITHDGNFLAAWHYNTDCSKMYILNAETNKTEHILDAHDRIRDITYSKDKEEKYIISTDWGGRILMWTTQDNSPAQQWLAKHLLPLQALFINRVLAANKEEKTFIMDRNSPIDNILAYMSFPTEPNIRSYLYRYLDIRLKSQQYQKK